MLKKLKLKMAARRLERANAAKSDSKKGFWSIIKNACKKSGAAVKRGAARLWKWILSIDLIGLINLTLLITIIVLFSVLINNILNPRKETVILVEGEQAYATVGITPKLSKNAKQEMDIKITLPIKQTTRITLPVKKYSDYNVKAAGKRNVLYGDIVIDGEYTRKNIPNGTKISGNLYLQNMRKYSLPCDIRIDGDLYLRNVHMMRFCGDFTITGNIYVSRNSSFGAIPRTAKLGGSVIF